MIRDFLREYEVKVDDAVVLGKGPTFNKFKNYGDRFLCGINHVSKLLHLDIAIFCHLEAALECKEYLGNHNCVLMPYHPLYTTQTHSNKHISEFDELMNLNNLYCFNANWQKECYGDSKMVHGFGTTAHYLTELLALQGVKKISFFGIDGGRKAYGKQYYSEQFHHDPKSYFESGMVPTNFDDYWTTYFVIRRKYGLSYTFA